MPAGLALEVLNTSCESLSQALEYQLQGGALGTGCHPSSTTPELFVSALATLEKPTASRSAAHSPLLMASASHTCVVSLAWWLRGGKESPAMQETQVRSLDPGEDPLEKGMAMHSSIVAWRILWIEEPGRLQSVGLQTVRHDGATNTFTSHRCRWFF